MNIYIRNKNKLQNLYLEFKNKDVIYIDINEDSPLKNPFKLKDISDDRQLNAMLDQYAKYFKNQIDNHQKNFIEELERIKNISKTNDVVLLSLNAPRKCHAEIIKNYLNKYNA